MLPEPPPQCRERFQPVNNLTWNTQRRSGV